MNDYLKKDNIIFAAEDEKEKSILLNSMIHFFHKKEEIWKSEFFDRFFLNLSLFNQIKDINTIFTLSKLIDKNFLGKNFKFLIEKCKNQINEFSITDEIKIQINDFFNCLKDSSKKEEVSEEIWSILLLSLIKIDDKEKFKEILSIIEKLKGREKISKRFFQILKKFINSIPQFKDYCIDLIIFYPNEYDYLVNNINNYSEYIDMIEKNINVLGQKRIDIFPYYFYKQPLNDSNKTLHQIINILRESKNKNIYFDTYKFKEKFNNYLLILNQEEKRILKEFLKINKPRDIIINEIRVDQLRTCKNNEEIINILIECQVWFDVIKDSVVNLDLENLTQEQITKLKEIIKLRCQRNKEKEILYLDLFKKIKNLAALKKIWRIFGYFTFDENKENYINEHLEKFWDFYNSDKNNINNSSYFFHMFFFLKANEINKFCLEFLKKILEIDNLEMIIKIIDSIMKYQKDLNEEESKIVYNYFIYLPSDKFNSIKELFEYIPSFLLKNLKEKTIEIDDFYKDTSEIIGIFKIFNFLCNLEEFKNTNYYKIVSKNFEEFIKSIEENEINFNQLLTLNDLIEKPSFNEKLIYFKFTEREKKSLVQKIHDIYDDILEKKKKLEECKKYLEEFPSAEDSKQKNMIISKIRDSEKTLKKFLKSLNEKNFIQSLDKLYERAQKFNKMRALKTSLIFMNEIENRVDKEEGKIRFLETKINDMRKILTKSTIDEINVGILNDFLSLFSSENELLEEINNLKNYFKSTEDTTIIEKYLIFNLKKNKILNSTI